MREGGASRVINNTSGKLNLNANSRAGKLETSRGLAYRHQSRQSRGDIFNGQPYDCQTKAAHRTSICPFLLRVFVKIGEGNGSREGTEAVPQSNVGGMGSEEFQVYAWMNDSLREVVNLIKDIVVEARDPRAKLKLQRRCHESDVLTEMGVVSSTYHNANDRRTLRSFSFEIGDTIDLTIEQQSKKSIPMDHTDDKNGKVEDENELDVEGDGDYDQEQEEIPIVGKKDSEGESQSTVGPTSSAEISQENINVFSQPSPREKTVGVEAKEAACHQPSASPEINEDGPK